MHPTVNPSPTQYLLESLCAYGGCPVLPLTEKREGPEHPYRVVDRGAMRTSMRRHCLSSRRGGYCLRPSATAALCPSRAMLLSALPVSHTLLGWLCAFDEIRLDSG